MYGTITDADTYLQTRLNTELWETATDIDKTAAITEATFLIDRLNYTGAKAVASQADEFPRDDDTTVPTDIEYAAYEIAYKLLEGADVDLEIENIRNASLQYESVHETYQRGIVADHLAAGIPSARAWLYLKPYLADPYQLTISRKG